MNIDEGFLSDSSGATVDIPAVAPRVGTGSGAASAATAGNTFVFLFCALGGHNAGGAVSLVDLLSPGLSRAARTIAPLPSQLLRGGEVSSAYTGTAITSCGQAQHNITSSVLSLQLCYCPAPQTTVT